MDADINRYLEPHTRSRLRTLELKPRGLVEGRWSGRYRSPFLGFSVEFADYRKYGEGDDARHIDYDLYARTGKLFVRQYQQETNFTTRLVIDVSESMTYPLDPLAESTSWRKQGARGHSKLLCAARLAAGLAYLITKRRDAVAVAFYNDGLVTNPAPLVPRSSPAQLERLSEALDEVEPRKDTPTGLGKALLEYRAQTGRRELIIILSDMIEAVENWSPAVQQLRLARHEVLVLQILHPDELDFPFEDPMQFEGIEGNRTSETIGTPADIAEDYRRKIEDEFLAGIRTACNRLGAGYQLIRTDSQPSDALLQLVGARQHS